MAIQNKSNHIRLSPMYHGVLLLMVLSAIVISLYLFIKAISNSEDFLILFLLVLNSFTFLVLMLLSRTFALKAQDRAIRAEESLRHFILTGKPIHPKLRLGQIIALRFAADEELIELTEKTIAEDLNQNQIKELIKNWKADNHRV
jgi:hypothetical protein